MPLALAPRTARICPFCKFRLSQQLLTPSHKSTGPRRSLQVRRVVAFDDIRQLPPPNPGLAGRQPAPRRTRGYPDYRRVFVTKDAQYGVFEQLVLEQTDLLLFELSTRRKAYKLDAWGIKSQKKLFEKGEAFKGQLRKIFDVAKDTGFVAHKSETLLSKLRHAFVEGEVQGLENELQHAFLKSVIESRIGPLDTTNQKKLADLRHPIEFYPATRALQRTIHLHVGPTNSGKTYTALKRLEEAESGIYAGPLRLLAHEVYTRFNAKGKKCALITGEERRIPTGMRHVMNSCTVEMVPLNAKVDVAVIDEIQMMGDQDRGWAWTQAFLGVQAKEVHLCGELRTTELVKTLCEMMGDKLVIHEYQRLSPLKPMTRSLSGQLKNLQKGDAVILFSRLSIHAMKSAIERATGKRCAVVYGSLPPETRAQQAALFNDPNNDYDFLAASDAVGMGLNLSIKRIIFEATSKHNGTLFRPMEISELKQIAGRAGRFKTAHDAIKEGSQTFITESGSAVTEKKSTSSVGWVTTLEDVDLPVVQKAMVTDAPPLQTAGVLPPSDILMQFASYFPPETPFSYIILRVHDFASLSPNFHLCDLQVQLNIADIIQPYKLTTRDRTTFINAPVALRDHGFVNVLREFAQCVADQSRGELLDIKSINLELLDQKIHDHPLSSKGYLRDAELMHKGLTLYLWLSYRFVGVFTSQALAFHVKELVEKKIDECLAEFGWDDRELKKRAEARARALRMREEREGLIKRVVGRGGDGEDKESGESAKALVESENIRGSKVDENENDVVSRFANGLIHDIDAIPTTQAKSDAPFVKSQHNTSLNSVTHAQLTV